MQPARTIYSYPDTISCGQLFSVRISLAVAVLSTGLAGIGLSPAAAQIAASQPQITAASPDAIKQREQELQATRAQQQGAAEAQAKLRAEIAAIGQDRSKLNEQLIEIAAQVRGVETRIDDAEARLRPLDTRELKIRGSLDSRRLEIVEVLAALQRAGRRSPPALPSRRSRASSPAGTGSGSCHAPIQWVPTLTILWSGRERAGSGLGPTRSSPAPPPRGGWG